MREIEFRGKIFNSSEWVYGFLIQALDISNKPIKSCIIKNISNVSYNGKVVQDYFQIDLKTLGQYTGLNDKNGTKIYEGDIVKTSILHDIGCYPHSTEEIVEVKYIEGCFYPLYDYERGKIEVIGNIHDNPELLKE